MIHEFRPQQQIRYRDSDGTMLEHECFQLGVRGTLSIEPGPREVKVRRRAPNGKVQVLTYSAMGVTLGDEPPEAKPQPSYRVDPPLSTLPVPDAQVVQESSQNWMSKRGGKR